MISKTVMVETIIVVHDMWLNSKDVSSNFLRNLGWLKTCEVKYIQLFNSIFNLLYLKFVWG